MRLEIAAQTDIGKRKKKNEDFYGVFREDFPDLKFFKEGALLCVADGLGGHIGGEIASKLAVSMMRDMLKAPPPPLAENPAEDRGPLLAMQEYFARANASIFQSNKDLGTGLRPMGTTLLTALVAPGRVYVGSVGDTRCYLIRDFEIVAKTEDHSWVDEQVKLGLMTKTEAESDNRRNIVTRSIGTHESVEVDTYIWPTAPGDLLLLCTDGLINMAKDAEILAEFRRGGTLAEIVHRLVDLANEKGGKDNITLIVAAIEPSALRMLGARIRSLWRRRKLHVLWLAVTLASFALGYGLGWLVFAKR